MSEVRSRSPRVADWVEAARPRTLVLSLAGVLLGGLLAAAAGPFSPLILSLTILTAILLQILSNLANDYGDSLHGADSSARQGPRRTVQAGRIRPATMRRAMGLTALFAALSGLLLLWLAIGATGLLLILLFALLGGAAIWAAVAYTASKNPYGYRGLGDLFVFIFFGVVGVAGSYVLQAGRFDPLILLPAASCGLLAVAVLNVNNVRDIESDRLAGKISLPVRLGLSRARRYHWLLLGLALATAVVYVLLRYGDWTDWLFLLAVPLVVQNGLAVWRRRPVELDPYLRQMSLTTLAFAVLFGMGQLL